MLCVSMHKAGWKSSLDISYKQNLQHHPSNLHSDMHTHPYQMPIAKQLRQIEVIQDIITQHMIRSMQKTRLRQCVTRFDQDSKAECSKADCVSKGKQEA